MLTYGSGGGGGGNGGGLSYFDVALPAAGHKHMPVRNEAETSCTL